MSNKKFMMFLLAGALITGAPQLPAFADSADQVSVTAEENNIISNDEASDVSVEEETGESEKELPAETVANVTGKDVAEDDSEFTERILYTTYNRDDDPSEHLKDEVIVNGKTYKLKTASQPVYVKSENIDPDEMMYNSEVFTGDENSQEHTPKQYMTDDSGKEYELVSKELLEQTAQERTEYREAVVEFNDVEAGVVLPKDHEIKFTDVDTAQEVTAELDYIREQVISEDCHIIVPNLHAEHIAVDCTELGEKRIRDIRPKRTITCIENVYRPVFGVYFIDCFGYFFGVVLGAAYCSRAAFPRKLCRGILRVCVCEIHLYPCARKFFDYRFAYAARASRYYRYFFAHSISVANIFRLFPG